jgi:predicted RNase H-like HicB family nuclease
MKQGIRRQSYFAVFDPAEEGGFNVSFPNFSGCVTFGKNFEEAKKMAKEVLELWVEQSEAGFGVFKKSLGKISSVAAVNNLRASWRE